MKVLIIGAGGVGTVVAHKCAEHPDVFSEIVLASRTKRKCDVIAENIKARHGVEIVTDCVDADEVPQLVELFRKHKPVICINVALPYQDLTIMEACLQAGVNYLDTASQLRTQGRGAFRVFVAVGVPRAFREGRPYSHPGLRLRPGCKCRVHRLRRQASFQRDAHPRHRGLQRR